MMKKFILFSICALCAGNVSAEQDEMIFTSSKFTSSEKKVIPVAVLPKSLSYDGNNMLMIETEDDAVSLYDKSFTLQKSLTVKPSDELGRILVTSQQEALSWSVSMSCDRSFLIDIIVKDNWTPDSIVNALSETGRSVTHSACALEQYDDMYVYNNTSYYEESLFGQTYPYDFLVVEDSLVYECYNVYYSKTAISFTDWQEIQRDTVYSDGYISGIGFINVDNETFSGGLYDNDRLLLTQTFFNNDENYEYIRYTASNEFKLSYSSEGPTESSMIKVDYYYSHYDGLEVVSENNSVLKSISFPQGFSGNTSYGIKMDNYFYLFVYGYIDDSAALIVYKIGHAGGTSIEQVTAPIKLPIRKTIKDGKLYIEDGQSIYDAIGRIVH